MKILHLSSAILISAKLAAGVVVLIVEEEGRFWKEIKGLGEEVDEDKVDTILLLSGIKSRANVDDCS